MELITYLFSSPLPTVLFIVGALFFLLAITRIEGKIEITKPFRLLLGFFGLLLIFFSLRDYLLSSPFNESNTLEATPTVFVNPTDTLSLELTDSMIPVEDTSEPNLEEEIISPASPTPPLVHKNLTAVCWPEAFSLETLSTTEPLFKRPEGFTSGWIIADPSNIILPDGILRTITTRYSVLIIDLAEVQLKNVPIGSDGANARGCWYNSETDISVIFSAAEFEYDKMRTDAPDIPVAFYKLSKEGLEIVQE
jgi:hypothetical protein